MAVNGQLLRSMGHRRGLNRRVRLNGAEGTEDRYSG